MRRRRRDRKYTPQKNNSIDLMGNEKNGYPVPDHKTVTNDTNEPSDTHKKKIPQRGNHGRGHQEIHGEDTRHG
jgi:hypothetical protein